VKVSAIAVVVVEVVVFVVVKVVASAGLNIVTTSEETTVQLVHEGIQQYCLGHLRLLPLMAANKKTPKQRHNPKELDCGSWREPIQL
jgi:hypothetical protein